MRAYLAYVCAVLQIASRNVERQVWTVKHAAEHKHIFGYDLFYIVGNENGVIIQLDLALKRFKLAVDSREIENSLEVERIVGVYMNVEKRVALAREYL